MTGFLRAIVVLATAGAISFPTQPPSQVDSAKTSSRRRAVAAPVETPSGRPQFVASQLEYYLNDDGIAYIRPGLKIIVNKITIPADRKPVVELTITDDFDQPLDRNGKITPGVINPSFILATWDPATRHYTSYTTRTVTTPASSPRPGVTAIQAGADSGGKLVDTALGKATYTFGTALPANFDATKTHTLGIYATRNLTAIIGKNYYFNVEHDFRPDGAAVTAKWDKIRDANSCNNCHDVLSAHGGSRRDVKLCVLCHSPQTVDPDTGETMDMKVLVHKIHAPGELSKPYIVIGNSQSVHNYSEVTYPQDVRNCDNCHEGTVPANKPTQSDVWMTQPSRAACGSCHDDIDWTTGANHVAGPQASDAACANCHIADSGAEFDASIAAAHTIPTKSDQLTGIKAEIISVSNVKPGQKPTIVMKVTNKNGNVDPTKISTFSPIHAGPTSSYTTYYRENAKTAATYDAATGLTTYTFTNAIPADAKGSWAFSADVYNAVTLKRADGKADITNVRDAAINPIKYASLTDGAAATPRRVTVSMALCNDCHDKLALHGGQRMVIDECVMCHNPVKGDAAVRPATEGEEESVSFQRMIHRIHTGIELTQDLTIFGNGSSRHNYNEVTYPGDRRNCAACHINSGQQLPPGGDPVITKRDFFSPQGPGTASCLGCHDGQDAAAHAFLNTTQFGGKPAEACATCHGRNSEWSVDKVHAR